MQVKISHTLDIDEIPQFIQENLKKSLEKCNYEFLKYRLLNSSYRKEDISNILKLLDDLRQSLFSLDINLEECHSILKGYEKENSK